MALLWLKGSVRRLGVNGWPTCSNLNTFDTSLSNRPIDASSAHVTLRTDAFCQRRRCKACRHAIVADIDEAHNIAHRVPLKSTARR
jgi:hypothetical protein